MTYEGSTRVVERALDSMHSHALLEGLRRRGAHPADAVLAAAAGAAAADLGCRAVRVVMELHGREEEVVGGADVSRTVGWFTALVPVLVEAASGAGPREVLDSAREACSRHALEHGLWRYGASDTTVRSRLEGAERPWVSVNYLGGLGSVFTGTAGRGDDGLVEVPLPYRGDRGPGNPRPFHWEFSAYTTGDELRLRLAHAGDSGQAERLLDMACDYLRSLAAVLGTADQEESR
ncbi:hypothetical protein [Streptomyces sp. S465]|uniref:hypothetical protein n=1 Tax=Streptomyces sp. S465 TaxID=2979468 RepID=UPI0022A8CBDD|nr:hypothetical protein [Streptomyces sp. S465]WAP53526.1 hypothetical protein N6H00_00335 [Streptomyces sp. S465]